MCALKLTFLDVKNPRGIFDSATNAFDLPVVHAKADGIGLKLILRGNGGKESMIRSANHVKALNPSIRQKQQSISK